MSLSLLVCAATAFELKAYLSERDLSALESGPVILEKGVACAVTGVGIPATLLSLPRLIQTLQPERILNTGIAGAYPNSGLAIGDIVLGTSEVYGDIGFELPEEPGFQSIGEAAFGGFYREALPLTIFSELVSSVSPYAVGRGCTVNTCTGTERMGRLREQLFEAQFETMEGAAVASIGQEQGIPVMEIRAISNIAARRDMQPDNIRLALASLRNYFEVHL
jgi:futalosine hydrolase